MVQTDIFENYFRVHLDVFEGPLDLLLFLIRKNELDIHEVSLAGVTEEYMEYVSIIKFLDLEMAGEYLLIAATLLKIKSSSLFPKKQLEPEDEILREELIQHLLKYQKIKEMAELLREREEEQRKRHKRNVKLDRELLRQDPQINLGEIQMFDLLSALRDVLKNVKDGPPVHSVELSRYSVEKRIDEILAIFETKTRIRFKTLISGETKAFVIVSFIAILELIRQGDVSCSQSRVYGPIWITHKKKE